MISLKIAVGHGFNKIYKRYWNRCDIQQMWVEVIEIAKNNNSVKHCISTQYEQQM